MPHEIVRLPVQSIEVDKYPLNRRVLGLVAHLLQKRTVPPIHVQRTTWGYRLLDGRHRILAYKLLQRPYILAKVGK